MVNNFLSQESCRSKRRSDQSPSRFWEHLLVSHSSAHYVDHGLYENCLWFWHVISAMSFGDVLKFFRTKTWQVHRMSTRYFIEYNSLLGNQPSLNGHYRKWKCVFLLRDPQEEDAQFTEILYHLKCLHVHQTAKSQLCHLWQRCYKDNNQEYFWRLYSQDNDISY